MVNTTSNKVKLHVITGFLGAGKTTFINACFESDVFKGEKIVLIENEFGKVNIDSLILDKQPYKIVELTNGCICCTLKGEVVDSLINIYKDIKPDRVIIEPSGVFNANDLNEIMKLEVVNECFDYMGMITMVDLYQYKLDKMRSASFYQSQLMMADHIVVSKLSFYDSNPKLSLEDDLKLLEESMAGKSIHFVNENLWDKDFGDMIFNGSRQKYTINDLKASEDNHHIQGHDLFSFDIQFVKSLSKNGFDRFVEQLNTGSFGEVIRLKGYVEIDSIKYLVNYVNKTMELSQTNLDIACQLVFIVLSLNRTAIIMKLKDIQLRRNVL